MCLGLMLLVRRFSVGIMMDTEGSEVHTSALEQPIKAEVSLLSCIQVSMSTKQTFRLLQAC